MSIRYIIVGLGNIGTKRLHILGSRCVATVDLVNPKADYRQIEQIPLDQFDAAVLCVPNQVKLELLNKLLTLGKHVLVEKPLLFPDLATAQTLESLANDTKTVCYTSYNHRFEPLIGRLKELLDQEVIGAVYHVRMVYGNGTVQNCVGTWREAGWGVLEDLGCHLIDLTAFLFNYTSSEYLLWEASPLESRVFDHCIFATADRKIVLECATTMWKNTFTVDIWGQLGSLHLRGLCKWGPSTLVRRQRVFPSGVPIETREVVEQADRTWHRDTCEFEHCIKSRKTSFASDLRISRSLQGLAQSARGLNENLEVP